MKKRLYSLEFCGHYPVGAVAVAVATSKEEAKQFFSVTFIAEGLPQEVDIAEIKEIPMELGVTILLDGDY